MATDATQVRPPVQKPLPILFQLLVLLALGMTSLAADRKKEPTLPKPPPQPVAQTVKVRRGEKLTIPLRIYGSQRETLQFLIRKEPVNGKLSEPEPRDRESAIVTYEPPADLEINRDQFSYAVQNSAGVSAAVDVVISIVDDPTVLFMPDTVTFQPILAGQTGAQEIEISNRGGGMAAGEMTVDAPWRIEAPADYRLGAGEQRKVKLVFAPTSPGPFRGELHFSSDKTRTVALQGEAMAALSAVPPTVELQVLSGEVIRTGVFELVNGTSEPQTVTLTENPHLQIRKTFEIPPGGRTPVTVQTVPGYVEVLNEEIVAQGAGVQLRIPVKAKAVGPVLRPIGEQLNFGNVAPGRGGAATIEVENAGGADGYWRWETIAPFVPAEQDFKLGAGMKKTLAVQLDPAAAGEFRAVLKLVGEQQTVEIPAEANVFASASASSTAPRSSTSHGQRSTRTESSSKTSMRASRDDSTARTESSSNRKPPLAVSVQRVEPTGAVLSWPSDLYKGSFRLESRSVRLDRDRKLNITWSEVPSVHLQAKDKQITGEIGGLAPGTLHTFRVVNIPEGSNVGIPVGNIQFATPTKQPFFKITVLRVLVLALIACFGTTAWRRFRAK